MLEFYVYLLIYMENICFSNKSLILFLPAIHSDCQGDFSLEESIK